MIVTKRSKGYSTKRKYIRGRGFVDVLKNIGSYVVRNKDLLAKPLLGAAGSLAAAGLEEGGKALLKHILQRSAVVKDSGKTGVQNKLDPKSVEILQNIIGTSDVPLANIIGSGIKKF